VSFHQRAHDTYAPFIFSGIIAAGFGIYFWQRTAKGKTALDGFVLRIPLVRTLVTQYVPGAAHAHAASVLRGGIPLVEALNTTAGVIANSVVANGSPTPATGDRGGEPGRRL